MAYPSRRGAGAPGVNGADGKQVELQQSSDYVQWRYVGDTAWRNLMPLSMITGADGSDGRTVDLQEAGGWIQWRHQGDAQWQNLVSMDEMRGSDGRDGQPGASVDLRNADGFVQWKRTDSTAWVNIIAIDDLRGNDGEDGASGTNGIDGRAVQLQKSATHIQWKLVGDAMWQNIAALSELTGTAGRDGVNGNGVTSAVTTYQPSTSGTVTPSGTWLSSPPAVAKGQYLWSRTVTTYNDATTSTAYSSAYQGQDGSPGSNGTNGVNNTLNIGTVTSGPAAASITGNSPTQTLNLVLPPGAPGSNGSNGVGISSQTTTYQQSSSGTTPPTGTWTAAIPAVTKGTYLWTRIVLTLTDSSSSTSYAVAYQASDGLPGANGANYSPGTAAPRTVSLATPYQHTDLTKPFKVVVNARSTQTVTVAGLVSDKVELRVGPSAAAVAPAGAGGFSLGVWESGITGIALMVGASVLDGGQLTADAQAGWYFQINRVTGSNASIVSCFTQSMS